MKIKIKLYDDIAMPIITPKGDWIDLQAVCDVTLKGPHANTLNGKRTQRDVEFENKLIPLGVCMQLPAGYEAVALPRSSTYNKIGVILGNMQGVLDNSYRGNNDQWFFNAVAFRDTTIKKGTSICQFRIQLSQKATIWQKIKWLFWNGKIEFEIVDSFDHKDRGSSSTDNTTNK